MSFSTWWPFSPGGVLGPPARTYINNQYHEAIWVNVSVDIQHVKSIDASVTRDKDSVNVTVTYFTELAQKNGFTKIAPYSKTLFTPPNGTVYISIWKESGGLICSAFPRRQNGSAMVDANGCIKAGIDGNGTWKERPKDCAIHWLKFRVTFRGRNLIFFVPLSLNTSCDFQFGGREK